jgi:hypothetical protein
MARHIGFDRELGADVQGIADDDGADLSTRLGSLQHAYVSAIRDEVKFRTSARAFLGLAFNPVKS